MAKNCTRAGGRSNSPSAALDVCRGGIGAGTSTIGSLAWGCSTQSRRIEIAPGQFAPHPQFSGKNGGESLNLHQFVRDGVVLLGHVRGAQGGRLIIAPDMKQMLAQVDQFELDALKMVDSYIARMGLNAPAEVVPQLRNGYQQEELDTRNLEAAGIKTVIWATGYKFDFGFVKLPVTDEDGYPVQTRGITEYEGLYFLGVPWLHIRKSGSCSEWETTPLTSQRTSR